MPTKIGRPKLRLVIATIKVKRNSTHPPILWTLFLWGRSIRPLWSNSASISFYVTLIVLEENFRKEGRKKQDWKYPSNQLAMIQRTHFSTPRKALVKWSWVLFERPIKAMHNFYEQFMISEYRFHLIWQLLRSFYKTRFGPKTWVKKTKAIFRPWFFGLVQTKARFEQCMHKLFIWPTLQKKALGMLILMPCSDMYCWWLYCQCYCFKVVQKQPSFFWSR